jgi:hypothetical protein
MTAPTLTLDDFDEQPQPCRNRPGRGTERREAIRESAGIRRHRTRARGGK